MFPAILLCGRCVQAMSSAGFTIAGEGHPICPVMLWEEEVTQQFSRLMLQQENILVVGLSFPVVARGAARIRVQV